MRGVYTSTARITTLASAKTLLYITAPANKVVEVISLSVTNETNSTNEQLRCSVKRVSALGTPTASTNTPAPHEAGDQAASSTVKTNVTASEPTYSDVLHQEGFASLGGYYYDPTPEERPIVPGAGTVGICMESTPTSATYDVRLTFREIG